MNKNSSYEGFTLIEVLLVVALLAILMSITYIAINPAKNFADTRNAQRSADVMEIINAASQYLAEDGHTVANLGSVPACGTATAPIGSVSGGINLASTLVETYIAGIPNDPSQTAALISAGNTGYTICQTAGGRLQIAAPLAENGKTIVVKR
jgi:prepilin-type N-terminal cleavage/methylation domain-containing protein